MPVPLVTDLRAALALNLATIANVQVSAYMLANPTPPEIEIVPDKISYDEAMGRGLDTWTFIVRAYVGAAADQGAQVLLDTMLNPAGASSIKAAIEADRTLGGKAEDLQVTGASGYRIFGRAGGPELLGCEWLVDVLALGK